MYKFSVKFYLSTFSQSFIVLVKYNRFKFTDVSKLKKKHLYFHLKSENFKNSLVEKNILTRLTGNRQILKKWIKNSAIYCYFLLTIVKLKTKVFANFSGQILFMVIEFPKQNDLMDDLI
jgi:hypothetical protein